MQAKRIRGFILTFLVGNCLLSGGVLTARSEGVPPIHVDIAPAPSGELLAWDAVLKEQETKAAQTSADFFFSVTNISASDVVIDRVQTSCGCTVAKLPSQPWILTPHADGKINVSVDLHGKSGTFFKTITVFSTNIA